MLRLGLRLKAESSPVRAPALCLVPKPIEVPGQVPIRWPVLSPV